MDSWLNMVLMCGLLLIASLQTTNSFRFRRSEKIKSLETNIHHLQNDYNTLGTEWVAKSVFASHLDQLNSKASCTCQALFLERMLNIYEDMFKDMMNKSEKKEVKNNLTNVMSEVKRLRHMYLSENKVWKELQNIDLVKVKNGTIQGGALNDFLMVFNRASTEKHQ
ncbi:interferon gamma related [Rhinichthys klamathensis goyatoka]|uniref:interferon gamma related n=1 Tax=Rhinichthys klamathensis goyatoka TaxID=3034132 RepID=UPI0024B540F0|nr:interferon gamma related [Rhinichthys klamathensis goyatoka]